jgi:hypothetical protein
MGHNFSSLLELLSVAQYLNIPTLQWSILACVHTSAQKQTSEALKIFGRIFEKIQR